MVASKQKSLGKMKQNLNKHTLFNFILLCPIFLVISIVVSQRVDARKQDFAAWWQAGHMVLKGQNIYDTTQWAAVRESEGTALHSESTFQYPLPLAILFSLIAWLPVQTAYTLWIFFGLIATLTSIVILLGFYPARSGYLELVTIAGIFMYRPMLGVIQNGQIISHLLLSLSISIWLFHHDNWFSGGLVLSLLILKPSVGLPLLLLAGLWLLSRKRWNGIYGMIVGGLGLLLLGVLIDFRWVTAYISSTSHLFGKYYGMHPTLWGVVDKIFQINNLSLIIGFACTVVILAVEAYFFWQKRSEMDVFPAFAMIVPAALLMALYLWNHDQLLLTIPIVFLLINVSEKYGTGKAAMLMIGVVGLAIAMVALAYRVGNDVGSVMNSLVLWLLSLYFATRSIDFRAGRKVVDLNEDKIKRVVINQG